VYNRTHLFGANPETLTNCLVVVVVRRVRALARGANARALVVVDAIIISVVGV